MTVEMNLDAHYTELKENMLRICKVELFANGSHQTIDLLGPFSYQLQRDGSSNDELADGPKYTSQFENTTAECPCCIKEKVIDIVSDFAGPELLKALLII